MQKKIILILMILLCVFTLLACKKNKAVEGSPSDVPQQGTVEVLDVGAKYTNEPLGFSIELTEYWYQYTQIVEYGDYVAFTFNGDTALAKDEPLLYIGKPEVLEKLGLAEKEMLGDNAAALNDSLEAMTEEAGSGNRDVGILGVLMAEKEQVLMTYGALK